MRTQRAAATAERVAVPKPLYAQVRDMLLVRVQAREWVAGETLPNEFLLAAEYNVSIGTIRRAVQALEDTGVVVRKQGRGTYVAGRGASPLQDKFCPLRSPSGSRLQIGYHLLAIAQRIATSNECAMLGRDAAIPVVEVRQAVECAGLTVGLEISVLPAEQFPRLETQLAYGQHLYPVFSDYGVLVTRIEEAIAVECADEGVAAQLCIGTGTALMSITRRAYSFDTRPVEYRIARYLPAHVRCENRIC